MSTSLGALVEQLFKAVAREHIIRELKRQTHIGSIGRGNQSNYTLYPWAKITNAQSLYKLLGQHPRGPRNIICMDREPPLGFKKNQTWGNEKKREWATTHSTNNSHVDKPNSCIQCNGWQSHKIFNLILTYQAYKFNHA